jgi:hypothetical protein
MQALTRPGTGHPGAEPARRAEAWAGRGSTAVAAEVTAHVGAAAAELLQASRGAR